MDIQIAQKLRELRTQKKNTQEQLAVHLGVTAQAVSKWERGDGCPDIAQLPAIAFYYGVTVDHLLGVDDAAKQGKLSDYVLRSWELSATERVALWREAYREFPHESLVLHNLAWALRRDDMYKHADELIELCQQLLTEAKQSGEYFGAINTLCRVYAIKGDMETARAYASKAGRYIGTENQLMIRILEGEEAADFCKWNIETLTDLIADNTDVMLKKGCFTLDEQIDVIRRTVTLYDLMFDKHDSALYRLRAASWSMKLATCYAQIQNKEETRYWIDTAMHHAEVYDVLEREGYELKKESLPYLALKDPQSLVKAFRAKLSSDRFAFLEE